MFRSTHGVLPPSLHFNPLLKWLSYYKSQGEDIYTETGKRPGKENTTGLVAGHAYTLIAVKMTSKGDKLMKLRNPWGNMEWTGDWSDKSPLWTQQMQVGVE